MTRSELHDYIEAVYSTSPESPWAKYPTYAVYRHSSNKKWFALAANVSRDKLGLSGNECLDIVNLKSDPVMIGSLLTQPGFFPAYHMSKGNWITVALDGSAPDDTIRFLLDLSYDLTGPKKKRLRKRGDYE